MIHVFQKLTGFMFDFAMTVVSIVQSDAFVENTDHFVFVKMWKKLGGNAVIFSQSILLLILVM